MNGVALKFMPAADAEPAKFKKGLVLRLPCASADDCISDGHGDSRDRVCADGICVTDFCAEYAPAN